MPEVWSWPGCTGGVLADDPRAAEDLDAYRRAGGYGLLSAAAPAPSARVHRHLAASPAVLALRGRGGAAYPFWAKAELVRTAVTAGGAAAEVVANGAEGEPLSVKDRYLMRHRPHLVLDGVALAAAVVGARRAHLYVADPASRTALRRAAAAALEAGLALPEVVVVPAQDTFVAGEASAVVRAIDTGVARPRDSPERTSQTGVGGAPTLLSNVETLARLARAAMPDPPAGDSPLLVTVSGPGLAPALVEVPYGLPAGELVTAVAGESTGRSVLAGGFFGGVLPVTSDLALSVESMAAHGGGLGCVSLHVLGPHDDPVAAAAVVADFYASSTAGQCRTCVGSTRTVAAALRGRGGDPAVVTGRLRRWSAQLVGRGACAVPDGVALLLRSLLHHYPEQLAAHLASVQPGALGPERWAHLVVPVPQARPAHLLEASAVAAVAP